MFLQIQKLTKIKQKREGKGVSKNPHFWITKGERSDRDPKRTRGDEKEGEREKMDQKCETSYGVDGWGKGNSEGIWA